MNTYKTIPDRFLNTVKSLGQRGEAAEIAGPVIYKGGKYYEIEYTRKLLKFFKKSITGIIIVDDYGIAVKDDRMLKALLNMFYHFELFFYSYKKGFGSALKSDEQIEKDEQEYKDASSALEYLMNEGVGGAGSVKFVIDGLPAMRKQANDVLKNLIDRIENYKKDNILFSQEILDDLMVLYDESMVMSFQRIKFINSASAFYNGMKKELIGWKRKIKLKLDRKMQSNLLKLEGILSFFINILNYYNKVINYSEVRYIDYIHKMNNEEIEKSYGLIRNK